MPGIRQRTALGQIAALTEAELSYIRDRWRIDSVQEIADRLNRGASTVRKAGRVLGLGHYRPFSREMLREDYFDTIDQPVKAYILGLFAADGGIGRPTTGGRQIILSLQERDGRLVEFVRDQLAPGWKLSREVGAHVRFAVTSDHMADSLARLGVVERKTHVLAWPTALPAEFERSFILGYFDGDGCLSFTAQGWWDWSILGTRPFVIAVADAIERGCGLRPTGPYATRGKRPVAIRANCRKARLIDAWLNQDGMGLPRKHLPYPGG